MATIVKMKINIVKITLFIFNVPLYQYVIKQVILTTDKKNKVRSTIYEVRISI